MELFLKIFFVFLKLKLNSVGTLHEVIDFPWAQKRLSLMRSRDHFAYLAYVIIY